MALIPMENDFMKTETVEVKLSNLTWTVSAAGKYYATTSFSASGKTVVAVTINSWGLLRASDLITPYINSSGGIGVLSNVNSFYNANAYINILVLYK